MIPYCASFGSLSQTIYPLTSPHQTLAKIGVSYFSPCPFHLDRRFPLLLFSRKTPKLFSFFQKKSHPTSQYKWRSHASSFHPFQTHPKMMSQGANHSGGLSVVPLLLQERFRQLQIMKEMREERELVRMLLCSNNNYNYCFGDQPIQMMLPPVKPQCQLSLSLWPDWRGEEGRSWPRMGASKKSLLGFGEQDSASDIDTSLHL